MIKRKEKSEGKKLISQDDLIGEIISLADSENIMFLLNQEYKLLQNILVIIVIKINFVNRMNFNNSFVVC